jgi:hypothetical protein
MAPQTPTFLTGDVIRALSCNRMDREDRLATAVVLEGNRILQVFPYEREAPSRRCKKGAVIRKAFDSVEAWVYNICDSHGLVELEVTSKKPMDEPTYEVWTLPKVEAEAELAPAPAEVGLDGFELEALEKVDNHLDALDIRTYKTQISFLADDRILSKARIFYKKYYIELFSYCHEIRDDPYDNLAHWFKEIRHNIRGDIITGIRVEREGLPTWTCFL